MDSGMILDLDGETALLGQEDRRSNSVDKDLLTPAQSRRKAQNRAAKARTQSLTYSISDKQC